MKAKYPGTLQTNLQSEKRKISGLQRRFPVQESQLFQKTLPENMTNIRFQQMDLVLTGSEKGK
jgi:hypothetical protein